MHNIPSIAMASQKRPLANQTGANFHLLEFAHIVPKKRRVELPFYEWYHIARYLDTNVLLTTFARISKVTNEVSKSPAIIRKLHLKSQR